MPPHDEQARGLPIIGGGHRGREIGQTRVAGQGRPLKTRLVQALAAACEDDAVLRSVAFGIALSILTVGCALAEPAQDRARIITADVQNHSPRPIQLTVTSPEGVVNGAAYPAAMMPGSIATVTFYVPISEDWRIVLLAGSQITRADYEGAVQPGCTVTLEQEEDEGFRFGCDPPPQR